MCAYDLVIQIRPLADIVHSKYSFNLNIHSFIFISFRALPFVQLCRNVGEDATVNVCRTEYDTDMTPEDSVKQIIILAEHFLLLIIICLCMHRVLNIHTAAFACVLLCRVESLG